jgi:two-component system, OmpR family, copper resistance phosphate regulon response regulator CusR
MRALIIDQTSGTSAAVQRPLSEQGFSVDLATDADEGRWMARGVSYDLIALDLSVPTGDGATLCRGLRQDEVAAPVLVLGAASEARDRVRALDAGADDYLVKPFDPAELVARARALTRRARGHAGAVLRCADIELDPVRHAASRAGRDLQLSAKEFALLEYFLRNQERLLTRTAIGESVWDLNYEHASNVIEVYISSLRRKLGDPPLIATIIGSGYRLITHPALTPRPRPPAKPAA